MNIRILRLPELMAAVGLSKPAIYAMIKRGEFPKPIQLSPRAVGWRSDEIEEWIDNRPEAAA